MRILFFLLLIIPHLLFGQKQTVYYNGKIFTANREHPFADAVIIKDDTIVAVGKFSEIKSAISWNAMLFDLNGRCLLPGLIDSHIHAISGGISLTRVNVFDQLLSASQLAEKARTVIAGKEEMVAGMVIIYGLNIATWAQLDEIDKTLNAAEFNNQPILLKGSDGHTCWGNKAILKKAGIDQTYIKSLSSERRNFFGFNDSFEPNGFAADSGQQKFYELIPEGIIDYHKAAINTMNYCSSNGITGWLEVAAAYTDEKETPILDAYEWLSKEKKLTGHVAATIVADANGNPQQQINTVKALRKKFSPFVSILGFKIFGDGVVEYPTQTAALSKPYNNRASSGVLMFNPKKFADFATQADKQGLLVHVHAIGDLAVTESLNGFEAVRKTNGNSGIPHTITHMQFVMPSDFDRFKRLNVLASLQLLWAYGDITTIDIIKPYVSPEIYRWQYPAHSLLDAGCTICGASDWPVSSANPFEAIAIAETRMGAKGVLDSAQCMPRIEMFYAYTINAAKALMMENTIGSIEPGKFADLVLIDKDIMTVDAQSLSQSKVLWTMFKGKVIYEAGH